MSSWPSANWTGRLSRYPKFRWMFPLFYCNDDRWFRARLSLIASSPENRYDSRALMNGLDLMK